MDYLDDMGVSKLSASFFFKVNYSFNNILGTHFVPRSEKRKNLPHM